MSDDKRIEKDERKVIHEIEQIKGIIKMTRLIVLGFFGLLMFLPTTVLGDENNISSSMKNSEETDKQRLIVTIHGFSERINILPHLKFNLSFGIRDMSCEIK